MNTVNYNSAFLDYMIPDEVIYPTLVNKDYLVTAASFNLMLKNKSGKTARVEFQGPQLDNLFVFNNTFLTTR